MLKSKVVNFFVIGLLGFFVANCSDSKIETALKGYIEATKSKDYVKMVAFMPPAIVQELGGSEVAVAVVKQTASNVLVEDLKTGKIQTVKEGDDVVAVIESETVGKILSNGVRVKTVGNIYGVSEDKGSTWYFIEGNDAMKSLLVNAIPSAVQKLNFKKQEIYVFKDNKWMRYEQ